MKYLILSFALTCVFILGCQNTPNQDCPPKIADESSEKNKRIVEQFFQYFNQHDWEKMAAMYSEPVEMKDPSLGTTVVKQTRADIVKKYGELQKVLPDAHDSIVSMYYTNTNNVVVEFIATGTAPDKTKIYLPICTVFTIENGLITKDYTYYDNQEEPK